MVGVHRYGNRGKGHALALVLAACLLAPPGSPGQNTEEISFREALRLRIETSPERPDEWILAGRALPEFYEQREWAPVWVVDGAPLRMLDDLIAEITKVRQEGLEPADYHLERLRTLLAQTRSGGDSVAPALLVELELRATDAFLMLASHLVAGRTDPESLRSEWIAVRREANPIRRLNEALESGVAPVLESLAPAYPDYARLRKARNRYEEIARAGGWPTVPEGPGLETGVSDERVRTLRERLRMVGDLDSASTSPVFDEDLRTAVVKFQTRHGLDADGVVGPRTLDALNVTARDRMRQIEVNMERWRWLPQDLGARYLIVNIPNFDLNLVEDGEVIMNMRAVVGRPYRRTPVFSDRMTYLVLNPRWNVPPSIATADILPKLRTDPTYLASQNMKLFRGWGADQRELAQSDVDWSRITPRSFDFHIRQEPGPGNALGRVKFMFPNRFNVYLHDTPSRELFARTDRTFSSGCIRLERPLDLAAYLLATDRHWTRQDLDAALVEGAEQTVTLSQPVPVHILYWTAWVARDGQMQFRNDVYSRDTPVRQALDEPPHTD